MFSISKYQQKVEFTFTFLVLLLTLLISSPVFAAAPSNDNFTDAELLVGETGDVNINTIDATMELNESPASPTFIFSVWYKWTATSDKAIKFTPNIVAGNENILVLYLGSSLDNLNLIGATANAPELASIDLLAPVVGETYYLSVSTPAPVSSLSLSWQPLNIISGTFTLPTPVEVGTGDRQIGINAYSQQNGQSGDVQLTIPEGQSSAVYALDVSPDDSSEWEVSYQCNNCNAAVIASGYYASGELNTTSTDYDRRTLLAGGEDHTSINMTAISANVISGVVTIPSSASADGQNVNIRIEGQNGAHVTGTGVFIAAGQTQAPYTISIAPNAPVSNWSVEYDCYDCQTPWLKKGYYSSIETTWDPLQATLISSNTDHANINVNVLTGNAISGTITLPNPVPVGHGGLSVNIQAYDENHEQFLETTVLLDEGSTTGAYTLGGYLSPNANWKVSYDCYGCGSPLLSTGYYSTAEPDTTSWDSTKNTLLAGSSSHTNINLNVLTGNAISGTITLPNPVPVGNGGVSINIHAYDKNNRPFLRTTVIIDEGSTTGDYTLGGYLNSNANWKVSYDCSGCGSLLLPTGYYSTAEPDTTSWDSTKSTLLAGSSSHTDINMTLIEGNIISGNIALPLVNSISNHVNVVILAVNQYGESLTNRVYLSEGQEAPYVIKTYPDDSLVWKVSYACLDCVAPVLSKGTFSNGAVNTTTDNPSEKTLLTGGIDHLNINMTALVGNVIEGSVILPVPAPSDVLVHILAIDADTSEQYVTRVRVPRGQLVVDYAIGTPIRPETNWLIAYECEGTCPLNWVGKGYYLDIEKSTWDKNEATSLVGGVDYTQKNLIILEGNIISGSITLDTLAPLGGIHVWVGREGNYVEEKYTGLQRRGAFYFYIPAAFSSTDYNFVAPFDSDESFKVEYKCIDCAPPFLSTGYYDSNSTNTSTWDISKASLLSSTIDHSGIDLRILVLGQANLNVEIEGNGEVNSNPSGIDCGTACSVGFVNNIEVQLTAQASEGNIFTHWDQACASESTVICTIDMNSDQSVTAHFSVDYDNDGIVDSEDSSVDLDKGLSILGNSIPIGNGQAEVSATNATDFGDLQVDSVTTQNFVIENKSNRDVTVTNINIRSLLQSRSTLNRNRDLTVANINIRSLLQSRSILNREGSGDDFSILTTFPFVITKGGSAEINVEFMPTTPGLQERTIVVFFDTGTEINFRIAGTGKQATPVTTESTLTVAINGQGHISSNPLGIDCGTTCSADFANNLNVQIIAQASEGNSFTHWNQACSSESTTTCTLDMSSAHSATAYFAIDYDNDGVVDSEDSSVDEDKGLSILGNNVPIENGQAEVGATDATDFGDLQLDFVTTQSFVIENKSNRDVTVTSINIRSLFQRRSTQKRADSVDDFSILTSFPFVITAGGSAEIEVEFIPTTQGLQERTVVVGFDTGTKINFRVAGNAVQAAPIAIASQNIPAIEPIGLIILLLSLFFLGYRRNN